MKPEIKAVALDVDGVLTDGAFWWGLDGSELKRFSFRDVMGISLASAKAGVCLDFRGTECSDRSIRPKNEHH